MGTVAALVDIRGSGCGGVCTVGSRWWSQQARSTWAGFMHARGAAVRGVCLSHPPPHPSYHVPLITCITPFVPCRLVHGGPHSEPVVRRPVCPLAQTEIPVTLRETLSERLLVCAPRWHCAGRLPASSRWVPWGAGHRGWSMSPRAGWLLLQSGAGPAGRLIPRLTGCTGLQETD